MELLNYHKHIFLQSFPLDIDVCKCKYHILYSLQFPISLSSIELVYNTLIVDE